MERFTKKWRRLSTKASCYKDAFWNASWQRGGLNKHDIFRQTLNLLIGSFYPDNKDMWRVDMKLSVCLSFWLPSIWVSQLGHCAARNIFLHAGRNIWNRWPVLGRRKIISTLSCLAFFPLFSPAVHPQETKLELFSLWGDALVYWFVLHLLGAPFQ